MAKKHLVSHGNTCHGRKSNEIIDTLNEFFSNGILVRSPWAKSREAGEGGVNIKIVLLPADLIINPINRTMYITDYITGTVIRGLGNGRKFGFPTANVQPDTPVVLEKGAYAVWVKYGGKRHKGMLYVGTRPTLNLHEITYEIHVIDARPNLYGKQIAFKPVCRIAEEKKFKSREELVKTLLEYKVTAESILAPDRSDDKD